MASNAGGGLPRWIPAGQALAEVWALVAIAHFNVHSYTGRPVAKTEVLMSISDSAPPSASGRSAVYATSGRLEHSCVPNVTYASKLDAGAARLTAIRPIAAGDHLSITYTAVPSALPTAAR